MSERGFQGEFTLLTSGHMMYIIALHQKNTNMEYTAKDLKPGAANDKHNETVESSIRATPLKEVLDYYYDQNENLKEQKYTLLIKFDSLSLDEAINLASEKKFEPTRLAIDIVDPRHYYLVGVIDTTLHRLMRQSPKYMTKGRFDMHKQIVDSYVKE